MKKIITLILLLIFIAGVTFAIGCKKAETPPPAEESAPQEPAPIPEEPAPLPEELQNK